MVALTGLLTLPLRWLGGARRAQRVFARIAGVASIAVGAVVLIQAVPSFTR